MKTFREACCEKFGISPEAFEEEVLWRCFYHPKAVPLGKLLLRINRRCFDPDFGLLRELADCTTVSDMRTGMSDFRYHRPICGFFRKVLRIRLSGQRLVDLGAKLLPENNQEKGDSQVTGGWAVS
jgi:hypothetical protein